MKDEKHENGDFDENSGRKLVLTQFKLIVLFLSVVIIFCALIFSLTIKESMKKLNNIDHRYTLHFQKTIMLSLHTRDALNLLEKLPEVKPSERKILSNLVQKKTQVINNLISELNDLRKSENQMARISNITKVWNEFFTSQIESASSFSNYLNNNNKEIIHSFKDFYHLVVNYQNNTENDIHLSFLRINNYFEKINLFIFVLFGFVLVLGAYYTRLFTKRMEKILKEDANRKILLISQSRMASLGEMASGIAHEINNPLAIISSIVAVMKKQNQKNILTADRVDDAVLKINDTIKRISKTIKGLRSIARNSDENDPYEKVKLLDIIDYVYGTSQEKLKVEGISFYLDIPHEINEYEITIQQVQISQVLINLIANAVDAIEGLKEKWIRVQVREIKNGIELRFIDSGSGFPKHLREKVFDPFYTTKEVGKGTGLGLSLCRTIIGRHGGDIFIDTFHLNTCFVIILPTDTSMFLEAG